MATLVVGGQNYDHVMPRVGGFPHFEHFDPEMLFENTQVFSSEVVQTSLPPGVEPEAILAEIREAMSAQAGKLSGLVDELRALVNGRDLTQLINSVAVPAMMVTFTEGESLADGDVTSSWAAKIEYLVGVALSVDPSGDADTPQEITQRVSQLISEIFEADQARIITEGLADADRDAARHGTLLQQLKVEYQSDRMPGYAVHLEQVDTEVFGRYRDYFINGLGFDPGDVIRVTRRHTRWVNQVFRSALDTMADALNEGSLDPEAGQAVRRGFDVVTLWNPADVAASTGVAVEQISALLDFFSAEYGYQPEFRVPSDRNRARTHPCIKLGDGRYLIPDPWSMSAILHQRLATEPKRPGYDPQKYHKYRQDAHERLVISSLERVFGTTNVYGSQHYTSVAKGKGEVDALVCTEWPLVVEAKAIGLTDSGRRGASRRVDTKVKEILGKALAQTDRALTYVLDESSRSFAPNEGGKRVELLTAEISGGTVIIVTFERTDPLAFGGLDVAGNVNRPTWVVSLTDLLMVSDILSSPAEFHHYARVRSGMSTSAVTASAEADLLGAYLSDRLRIANRANAEDSTRVLIGYSSEELNDFYTQRELGFERRKPGTDLPQEVAGALANTLKQPGWAECVDAVMSVEPSAWKKWKRFRNRHPRGGTFGLNDTVFLVARPDGEPSLACKDASIRLDIPASR